MAFPPEFSSTATYANRYDLDEIDVFLEGNPNNPMFFNISDDLRKPLTFGKHFFTISLLNVINQEYNFKPNSKILFELKSINNVVLKSDITSVNQSNGTLTCFVEVLQDPLRTVKEVQDGEGTLSIVASLVNSNRTITPIPNKFKNAVNYRCIFPIEIRKNIINGDSPFTLQVEHKTETLQGQFSFAKANISPLKTSKKGLIYNPSTGTPSIRIIPEPDDTKGNVS